jgi:tRNA uridine 5-carbamoylmethylation protein Kti12
LGKLEDDLIKVLLLTGTGGGGKSSFPITLAERIKSDGIQAVEIEYHRAYKSIESDSGSAVTVSTICFAMRNV